MANTYLTWTPSTTPTGSAKTWTYSVWVKMAQENPGYFFAAGSGTQSKFIFGAYGGGDIDILTYEGYVINANTARLFRDTNAWYHVVLACDTTQAVPANGIKLYINGVQETLTFNSQGSENGYTQNTSLRIGTSGEAINIGRDINDSGHWKGCMSHINFVDGQQLTPSAFGSTDSTTGEWKINTSPSVTYGTNGFFILKDGNSVTDQSGRGNNFTLGGGTLTKTEDNPSNVFATLNPLYRMDFSNNVTLSNGNTYFSSDQSGYNIRYGTLGASKGKFYYECKFISQNNHGNSDSLGMPFGISASQIPSGAQNSGTATYSYSYNYDGSNSTVQNNGGVSNYGTTPLNAVGQIGMCAFDLDNNKLYFGVNGVWTNSGNPAGNANGFSIPDPDDTELGIYFPETADRSSARSYVYAFNFGNGYFGTTAVSSAGTNASGIGIFEYDVPTGFTALSTKGLNL